MNTPNLLAGRVNRTINDVDIKLASVYILAMAEPTVSLT